MFEEVEKIKEDFGCTKCYYNSSQGCTAPMKDRVKFNDNFGYSKACLEGILKYHGNTEKVNLKWHIDD